MENHLQVADRSGVNQSSLATATRTDNCQCFCAYQMQVMPYSECLTWSMKRCFNQENDCKKLWSSKPLDLPIGATPLATAEFGNSWLHAIQVTLVALFAQLEVRAALHCDRESLSSYTLQEWEGIWRQHLLLFRELRIIQTSQLIIRSNSSASGQCLLNLQYREWTLCQTGSCHVSSC